MWEGEMDSEWVFRLPGSPAYTTNLPSLPQHPGSSGSHRVTLDISTSSSIACNASVMFVPQQWIIKFAVTWFMIILLFPPFLVGGGRKNVHHMNFVQFIYWHMSTIFFGNFHYPQVFWNLHVHLYLSWKRYKISCSQIVMSEKIPWFIPTGPWTTVRLWNVLLKFKAGLWKAVVLYIFFH